MNRRECLTAILGAPFVATFAPRSAGGGVAADARIDAARLRHSLEGLSVFGRPAGGTFADGVSRYAYSDADVAGRAYVIGLMKQAGLDPRIDAAGNILGRRAGRDPSLKPILFGSHIDSVPSGGNFDGQLGSLAAIEVVRTLNERHIATRHPLEVTIWSNEEGATVGSNAMVSELPPESLEQKYNGIRMADGLRKIGGDPLRLGEVRRPRGSIHCYLELHIEQGGLLAKSGIPIGVVDGIVSIDEYDVEIRGFANHAGTTPMADRARHRHGDTHQAGRASGACACNARGPAADRSGGGFAGV
jgi:N-carbamoyl-L-amino-acid hydrolase